MTFNTKFKIGQEVRWKGVRHFIYSATIRVESNFKEIKYELDNETQIEASDDAFHMTESDLLRFNSQIAR